jgi:hypothetical protein
VSLIPILPEYNGPRAADYYSTIIGAFFAGFFAYLLSFLIFRARRRGPADVALAVVFIIWGVICSFAVYRLYHLRLLIPYVTPVLWLLATAAELVGIYFIIREIRSGTSSDARDGDGS